MFVARFTTWAATRNATKSEKTTLIGLSTQAHESVFSPSAENMADETAGISGKEVEFLDTRKTDLLDEELSEATKHDLLPTSVAYGTWPILTTTKKN